jgi:hypothetical protein
MAANNSAFFERIAPASKPTGGSIVTIEHLFCRRRHRRFRRAGQRGSSTRRADARQSSPDSDTSGKRQLVFGPLARMSDIAADAPFSATIPRSRNAVAGRLAAASQQASAECPAQGRALYRLENCHDAARSDLINLGLIAFLR